MEKDYIYYSDQIRFYHKSTYEHCLRVARINRFIGHGISLPESELADLYTAGLLHDLGKTKVPLKVLEKPFMLSKVEWEVMIQHPKRGADMVNHTENRIVRGIASHHEYFDGKGYPLGLKGEAIPPYARIIAIADAIDAMTEPRPYRTGISVPDALKEVIDCAGSQFDPYIIQKLLKLH